MMKTRIDEMVEEVKDLEQKVYLLKENIKQYESRIIDNGKQLGLDVYLEILQKNMNESSESLKHLSSVLIQYITTLRRI